MTSCRSAPNAGTNRWKIHRKIGKFFLDRRVAGLPKKYPEWNDYRSSTVQEVNVRLRDVKIIRLFLNRNAPGFEYRERYRWLRRARKRISPPFDGRALVRPDEDVTHLPDFFDRDAHI